MNLYCCQFPGCTYSTKSKSKIDNHHIIPREIDSRSSNKLTVQLCKNHHSLIFHPKSKYGQHSIKTEESLIILGLFKSTDGLTIHYEDMSGNKFYYIPDTSTIIKD